MDQDQLNEIWAALMGGKRVEGWGAGRGRERHSITHAEPRQIWQREDFGRPWVPLPVQRGPGADAL